MNCLFYWKRVEVVGGKMMREISDQISFLKTVIEASGKSISQSVKESGGT
jgi:hypothetical protein